MSRIESHAYELHLKLYNLPHNLHWNNCQEKLFWIVELNLIIFNY